VGSGPRTHDPARDTDVTVLPRSSEMRRLYPDPLDSITVSEAYSDPSRAPHDGRPWVYLVMIASADGATAVDGVSGPLGGPGDKAVFATMREHADMVLVGAGTARAEHYGPPKRADLRIALISRSLEIDWASPLMTSGQVLIVTTQTAGPVPDHIPAIRSGEHDVDLAAALTELHRLGANIVMAEGGPSINGQLIAHDLVDELALTLSPALVAGTSSRVAHGALTAFKRLSLVHVLEEDESLFFRYVVQASGSR
jgi:riboflavin biosynthesis pyrimidine reductase